MEALGDLHLYGSLRLQQPSQCISLGVPLRERPKAFKCIRPVAPSPMYAPRTLPGLTSRLAVSTTRMKQKPLLIAEVPFI